MAKQKILSPALAAVLANGGTVTADIEATATPAATESAVAAAAVSTGATATETTNVSATPAVQAAAAVQAPAVTNPTTENNDTVSLVAHLKQELADLRTTHVTLSTKIALQDSQITQLAANAASLTTIVRTAAKRLCVALNSSAVSVDSLEGQNLCNHFNQLNGDFEKKYKVGAIAAVEVPAPTENSPVQASAHLQQAAVRAATSRSKQ